MTTKTKIWIAVAIVLTLVGLIIMTTTIIATKGDFSIFNTVKYETNVFESTDNVKNILIDTDTADVTLLPSTDGKLRVECREEIYAKHSVSVENGTLSIKLVDERKWYHFIRISTTSGKVTVYLPDSAYDSLSIDVSTGDIEIKDINAGALDISVSTGCTKLVDVNCDSLTSKGSTGDLTMKNVIAAGAFIIERSTGDLKLESCDAGEISIVTDTGDVQFESCDAGEISIVTDTGDVKGSLLSEKIFDAQTDTGRISVPVGRSGGVCRIRTDTGDIKITVE